MNDSEIENRIVGGVRRMDLLGITHPEPNPIRSWSKSAARNIDHVRIEIARQLGQLQICRE